MGMKSLQIVKEEMERTYDAAGGPFIWKGALLDLQRKIEQRIDAECIEICNGKLVMSEQGDHEKFCDEQSNADFVPESPPYFKEWVSQFFVKPSLAPAPKSFLRARKWVSQFFVERISDPRAGIPLCCVCNKSIDRHDFYCPRRHS